MVAGMLTSEAEAMKELMREVPIARLGRPEKIAAAVLWLCSPGASFVIGHALVIDGGYTVRGRKRIIGVTRVTELSTANS